MIGSLPYKGRKIAVLGLARSGKAAALALAHSGAAVLAWDDRPGGRDLSAEGLRVTDLALEDCRDWAALVMSPGIPLTHPAPHPIAARALAAGIPVIGDIELLFEAGTGARFIGITGTNGKSTTTSLIHHILRQAGRSAAVGGNLGFPVLDLPRQDRDGAYVIEMSSFQLDLIRQTRFNIAILLNLTPDHLDRHGDMAGYLAAKRRIFQAQQPDDTAVIGMDDDFCRATVAWLRSQGRQVIPISAEHAVAGGVYVDQGRLIDATESEARTILDLGPITSLPGRHNGQNAAAAYAACRAFGLTVAEIIGGLTSFPGLAHRQEAVGALGALRFVNDSKATNADAAEKALGCYDNIYWIAGGRSKAGGIASLKPYFNRIAHAYLIGEAAAEFSATLDGAMPVTQSGTLEAAVATATSDALHHGRPAVVLLSPACASFDQFPDFEMRGEAFRAAVRHEIARRQDEGAV